MINVAILSDQSLLTQGIITRLNQSTPAINVQTIESGLPDVFDQLYAAHPDVIIMESKDPGSPSSMPLNRLFAVLPHLVVIEVNIQNSDIQVIRSNQYSATGISDMVTMLQNASNIPGVYSVF